MTTVELLRAPERTQEDRPVLIDLVLAVRKSCLQDLLKKVKLPRTCTKPQIRSRIEEAVEQGNIRHETLVEFLDSVSLWGKQHVFLFDGPRSPIDAWRNAEQVHRRLKQFHLDRLFNAHLPLVLPEALTLSSIAHTGERLVTAVQQDEYDERAPHDAHGSPTTGADQPPRQAPCRSPSPEWDLVANAAMLQTLSSIGDGIRGGGTTILGLSPRVARHREFTPSMSDQIRRLRTRRRHARSRSHGIHYRRSDRRFRPEPRPATRPRGGPASTSHAGVAREGVGHPGTSTGWPRMATGPRR